jgi:3-methyladenine DNA glycosylase AlkC
MKNVFNLDNISLAATHLELAAKSKSLRFNKPHFVEVATKNLEKLELKQRSHQVTQALFQQFPVATYQDYEGTVELLLATLRPVADNEDLTQITTDELGVAGWMVMPWADYVCRAAVEVTVDSTGEATNKATKGENDAAPMVDQARLNHALLAVKELTKRFTAEFAVRFLLLADHTTSLKVLANWTRDPCHHVRRLVSEGTRPKLPWAMQLPRFIEEPELVISVLDKLKFDESEYVRRSVANHLNDISKDHPQRVVDILKDWLAHVQIVGTERQRHNMHRLVKHAGRTLIKQGDAAMLAIIGFEPLPKEALASLSIDNQTVAMGQTMSLDLTVQLPESRASKASSAGFPVLVDYCIYHLRGRGQHIKKVFKWKQLEVKQGESISLQKAHTFKPINTRRYYTGEHFVSVIINGIEQPRLSFYLNA